MIILVSTWFDKIWLIFTMSKNSYNIYIYIFKSIILFFMFQYTHICFYFAINLRQEISAIGPYFVTNNSSSQQGSLNNIFII